MFFNGKRRLEIAVEQFRRERQTVQDQFFRTAAASGRPRGLRWVRCDFHGEPLFAQEPNSGVLQALVAVAIGFEAVEGGGMEEVEAVSNVRAATAVFRFDGEAWTTDGRTVFNLDPQQTIAHFHLRPVEPHS
jgi:hypothetical protein